MQVGQHGVGLGTVEIGKEISVQAYGVSGGELGRQGHAVRQVAGDGLGIDTYRCFINADGAAVGREQPGGNFNKGRFAAAIGAQQAHQFARLYGKIHAIQRGLFAVVFAQAVDFIYRFHCVTPFLMFRFPAAGSRPLLRSCPGHAFAAENPWPGWRRVCGAELAIRYRWL